MCAERLKVVSTRPFLIFLYLVQVPGNRTLTRCEEQRATLICFSEMVLSQCGRRKAQPLIRGMVEHRLLTTEHPWTGKIESIFVVLRFPGLPNCWNLKPLCFPENRAARDSCVLAMTKDV